MKDILVAISHFDSPGRLEYLREVLRVFSQYPLEIDVLVDTNAPIVFDTECKNVTIVYHASLEHDFHLCWAHRAHFRDRINDYKYFFYCENDIAVPYENFLHYQKRFDLLWPNFIPGFVRVEKHNGEEYVVDVTYRQIERFPRWSDTAPLRNHLALNQPYHGFWCMPQDALKTSMRPDFVRLSDSREAAASYPMEDLGKTALVEIEDGQVSPLCWAYHVSNSYAPCPTSLHGKIRVSEIFL